jgi:hypothetical protein
MRSPGWPRPFSGGQPVDLRQVIDELRAELDLIDRAILSFQRLVTSDRTRERPQSSRPSGRARKREGHGRREPLIRPEA